MGPCYSNFPLMMTKTIITETKTTAKTKTKTKTNCWPPEPTQQWFLLGDDAPRCSRRGRLHDCLHNCMIACMCITAWLHNCMIACMCLIAWLPDYFTPQLPNCIFCQTGYLPGWRGVLRGVRGGEGWLSTPRLTLPSGWCCSGSHLGFDFNYSISLSSNIVDIRLGEWQCEYSPPNCSMLSFTHCRAISWSNIPENYSNYLFCQI